MNATLHIDTTEFQRAARQHMLSTSQELSKATNSRMFYLMLRAYILLPPTSPNALRQEIREKMDEVLEERGRTVQYSKKGVVVNKWKRWGKARQFMRKHALAQQYRAEQGMKGAYGKEMAKAAASYRRRRVGSVGYLKSAVVKAIKKLNGHFTQWGGRTKKANGKGIPENGALVAMAKSYGLGASIGNVGVFKGAKANVSLAVPGINPTVKTTLTIGIADDQMSRVTERYNAAFSKAFHDERIEMERHLASVGQALANQHNAVKP